MTARIYDFPLPTQLSGFQVSVGISDLQQAGLWDQVPADLQAKLTAADSWFSSGVAATQADLDELPDAVWEFIANELNLEWHPAAPHPTKEQLT